MSNTIHRGNVSFVNHEKQYVLIEYEEKGKKKSVRATTDDKAANKKKHVFHIGDTVSFNVKLSERGDRMIAANLQYLFNTAIDVLINKARTENNFIGYLKIVDDKYFVKEIESYLFFPVIISPWQIKPKAEELNEPVTFEFNNPDKKEKLTASLFTLKFIPEYYSAERAFKKKEIIAAEIYKITAYGIYLNLFGEKVQAKISPSAYVLPKDLKVGDKINVRLTYLSKAKIVVEPV